MTHSAFVTSNNLHSRRTNKYASTISTQRSHTSSSSSSWTMKLFPMSAMAILQLCPNDSFVFAFNQPVAFTPSTLPTRVRKGKKAASLFSNGYFVPSRFQLYSTREDVDSINDPVFEDVDGIGQLTNAVTTSAAPGASAELNVNNLVDSPVASIQDIASATTTSASTAPPTAVPVTQEDVISDSNDVFNIDDIISDISDTQNTDNNNCDNSNNIDSINLNINNPSPESIVDILNISDNSDTQTQQLLDPTAVVEGIIGGTALIDLDENKNNSGTTDTKGIDDTTLTATTSILDDDQTQQLIDPAAVVEGIIGGTALKGLDDGNNNSGTSGIDTPTPTTATSTLEDDNDDDKQTLLNIQENEEDLLMKSYNEYQGIEEVVQEQVQQIVEKKAEEVEETIDVPNMAKIIKFAIPAVGVWLCSPLLSLIDTSSVGLLSGTAQQAALNPAVAVTDYSAMLCAFMYTATTNLVAGAKGKEESLQDRNDHSLTKKTLVQALQVSGYVGIVLGTFLIATGPKLLRTIIGNDQIDPQVFASALRYVRIRALGMPAAVIIGSAQSASIGMQDIKSPMYVLLAAALVNFLGDVIFVPQASAWLGGAAGAAWATVFSQYAALAMFFTWMTSRPKQPTPTVNLTKAILELTGKSAEGKPRRRKFRRALQKLSTGAVSVDVDGSGAFTAATDISPGGNQETLNSQESVYEESRRRKLANKIKNIFEKKNKSENSSPKKENAGEFSVRGFLAGEEKMLLRSPTLEEAKIFWPYFIPVTTTAVGRVSSYIAMSHVVSSTLGTLSMAANQVILSVFYCLTPIADSLNLTAQSFVPAIAQKKDSVTRAKALRKITNNFTKGGLLFSVGMVGAVGFIPFVSKYFTSDPTVISLVNSIVPSLSGFFALHGIVCSLEGVLLGQKDLNFLGKAYASYFFIVPYFMLRVKQMALQGAKNIGLTSLWNIFFGYNAVRAVVWLVRTKILCDKAMNEAIVDE